MVIGSVEDPEHFPRRIRVAAWALKLEEEFGRFLIKHFHDTGIVTIEREDDGNQGTTTSTGGEQGRETSGDVLVIVPCGYTKVWDSDPHRGSVQAKDAYTTSLPVSVISCVSRKSGFHGGSDHDSARTLFGCDTGPGEYSGSAGGFEQVVPPEVMEQALSETGMSGQRSCKLSHRVMLWIVLTMGLLTHLPIRQVFKHGAECGPTKRRLRAATSARRVSVWVSNPCGGSSNSWFIRWRRRKRRGPSTRGTA